ncbi:MAG: phage terminase large subunit [Alphaproteobacteria bacterium]|nr:phage terminase large subunit [Alphaproteobacteria bacterium]
MIFYKKYFPLLQMDSGKYDTFALTGGRGSLKTGHVCRAVLCQMLKSKKRVAVFRETKISTEESLYIEFKELVNTEFRNRGFEYTKNRIVNTRTDSELFFMGLQDKNQNARENLKGLAQVDILIVDEAQMISKAVWQILLKTIRKKGVVLIVIYNRISDELPVESALFLDYENMKAPEKTYFVEVNYPEIKHLGILSDKFLEYAELIKKNKPEEYKKDYLNKSDVSDMAKVVKYWSSENVNEDIRHVPDLDIYWSLDFNVNPFMSTLSHYDGKKFFVFDELVLNNVITQDAVDEFIRRYPPEKVKGIVQICGDASGKYRKTQSRYSDYAIIINALSKAGYHYKLNLRSFNPPILARINAFNKQVFSDDGERNVLVHPKCKWLIYNMKNLKFKEGTSLIDEATPSQISDDNDKLYLGHIFDAVSYMVEFFKPVVPK